MKWKQKSTLKRYGFLRNSTKRLKYLRVYMRSPFWNKLVELIAIHSKSSSEPVPSFLPLISGFITLHSTLLKFHTSNRLNLQKKILNILQVHNVRSPKVLRGKRLKECLIKERWHTMQWGFDIPFYLFIVGLIISVRSTIYCSF